MSAPTAKQVAADLLLRLQERKAEPGELLESDDVVARRYGVSRNVARAAWGHLVRAGAVERRQGQGTFLVELRPAKPPRSLEERVSAIEKWIAAHDHT